MDPQFEELEHNPFADVVSPHSAKPEEPQHSTSNPLQSTSTSSPPPATGASFADNPPPVVEKERTSSVLNSKTPVEVDIPRSNDEFNITVHDPQVVGDRLKQHTIYSITTKTSSSLFRSSQMTVQRRFKEFLWLYQQLFSHNPGVIIPPVPEKHAIGRFDEDFVQNRRIQLERMLQKISRHPVLNKDPFFIMFLESEVLQTDVQEKKGKGGSLLSLFGDLNVTKFQETDEYFEQKRTYIDSFDNQLKLVAKAVDSLIKHRETLSSCSSEFGDAVHGLAQSEVSKASEKNLSAFAQVQKQLQELYAKQAEYDLLYLANTVDEYIRIVQSIKNAFNGRTKAYTQWQTDDTTLSKLRIALEKAKMNKSKPEKITQTESEILEAESKVVISKKEFEEVSKVLKNEMEAFEKEKVSDIRECLKGFLKSVVLIQKQIVRTWEDYLRNMEVSSAVAPMVPQ